tara:strand:- start:357 stop:590 length:234 start_codon:yes stop_codon:yes gene_type:complete
MINQPQQVDRLTGMPIEQALPVQPQAELLQPQSNTLGTALPVFPEKVQNVANSINGSVAQRQNSVTPSFYNANTQTV